MNKIRFEHPGNVKEDGTSGCVVGGKGKLFINGHEVSGVLEFSPNLMDSGDVAHVVIKLAVSKFTYGPDEQEYAYYQPLEGDAVVRIPTGRVRD